jgi:hypothetical protein
MRVVSQTVDRPSARDGGGAAAEVDGLSRGRRGEETEQYEDCDGWTKQAHYRPNNCIRRSIRRMLKLG